MLKRLVSSTLFLSALMLGPSAHAATFGRLSILSHLNEPLLAEIELQGVSAEDLKGMSVQLASADLYKEARVARAPTLDDIKLSLEKRDSGEVYIRAMSLIPVAEPALELLVEVVWPAGRIIRDYPLEINAMKAVEAEAPAPVRAPEIAIPPESKEPSEPTTPSAPAPTPPTPPKVVTVKAGDTLSKLVAQNKPEAVSLEQSMLAVLEANRKAFIRGNANLIRAGARITLPEGEAWSKVTQQEAKERLHLMAEDFEAYKAKMAQAMASSPESNDAMLGTSKGKITGSAEDKRAPPKAGPQDVLKLSRSEDGKDPKAREDLQKEENIARQRELKESEERAAQLQKNVDAMKKLLAEKEAKGKAKDKEKPKGAEKAKDSDSGEPKSLPPPQAALPEVIKPVITEEEKEHAREDKAEAETPKPSKKDKKGSKKEEDATAWSLLTEHPMAVAAGLLSGLLVGWLLLSFLRRGGRRVVEEDFEETSDAPHPDAMALESQGEAAAPMKGGDPGQEAGAPREDVDPIEEADVYIAYGRLAQAEEVLLRGVTKHPGRLEILMKLMDVYKDQSRQSDYEQSFKTLLSLATPDNPILGQARQQGRLLDPENPLYREIDIVPKAVARDDLVPPVPGETSQPAKSLADIDLDMKAPAAAEEVSPAVQQEMNTKLDLARAYIEIEDKDNARELLTEVQDQGTASQKAEAAKLLGDLGT